MTLSDVGNLAQIVGVGIMALVSPFVLYGLRYLIQEVSDIKNNHLLHIYQELAKLNERTKR